MLRPSYSDLMNVLNTESELESDITSRYTVVIAAAKRARQIVAGSEPQASSAKNKAVSIAVEEMYLNKLHITKSKSSNDEIDVTDALNN